MYKCSHYNCCSGLKNKNSQWKVISFCIAQTILTIIFINRKAVSAPPFLKQLYTIQLSCFFHSLGVGHFQLTCIVLYKRQLIIALFIYFYCVFLFNHSSSNCELFCSGDGEDTEDTMERSNSAVAANAEEHGEQSHLIVWQVQCPLPVPMNG